MSNEKNIEITDCHQSRLQVFSIISTMCNAFFSAMFKYFYAVYEENSPSCLTQCFLTQITFLSLLNVCPQSESFKDWNRWKSGWVKSIKYSRYCSRSNLHSQMEMRACAFLWQSNISLCNNLLEQEIVSGNGIIWAVCKSAPWPRHINHANIPPLSFLQAGCPSCCPTNSIKALKAITFVLSMIYPY